MPRPLALLLLAAVATAALVLPLVARPDDGALPGPAGSASIGDEEAARIMYALAGPAPPARPGNFDAAALERVLEARDRRFVAVLIEVLRGMQIGIVPFAGYDRLVQGLEALAGRPFGEDWVAWSEWYAGTALRPPPVFDRWKSDLLGRIDPDFRSLLRPGEPTRIRLEEVVWGGVALDGIPALDRPATVGAEDAAYLTDGEPVFGLAVAGDARAYPLRIMDWHEMANDVVGGVPVSLAYCTLCGAAIAYDTRAAGADARTFGSSGLLYRSNKLMYDRETGTLWNQFSGEPALGPLAGEEIRLPTLPLVTTTWGAWRRAHPATRVLSLRTGFDRDYRPGAAYGEYFASIDTIFPTLAGPEGLEPKARVFGLDLGGEQAAYPVDDLVRRSVVNDEVGGKDVVVVAAGGQVRVAGAAGDAGSLPAAGGADPEQVAYLAGAEVRAYERDGRWFRAGPNAGRVLDADGGLWRVTEDALVGPSGQSLPRLAGVQSYWFAWAQFHPGTRVFGRGEGPP